MRCDQSGLVATVMVGSRYGGAIVPSHQLSFCIDFAYWPSGHWPPEPNSSVVAPLMAHLARGDARVPSIELPIAGQRQSLLAILAVAFALAMPQLQVVVFAMQSLDNNRNRCCSIINTACSIALHYTELHGTWRHRTRRVMSRTRY